MHVRVTVKLINYNFICTVWSVRDAMRFIPYSSNSLRTNCTKVIEQLSDEIQLRSRNTTTTKKRKETQEHIATIQNEEKKQESKNTLRRNKEKNTTNEKS